MTRWGRYWFAEGGRVAAAVLRVAVATSVLLTLAAVHGARSPVAEPVYREIGVWMLLGSSPPPEALVATLWAIAWASTAAMLVGLATRASTAVSFVSSVALVSLSFSASRSWSHQYNVVLLAQLAQLGARGGDALSLDAWIRTRWRGLPVRDEPRAYQWSVRLVQLAVALMFASAACQKLLHGHLTLRWALSDNLRHHLLVRYDLAGLDRPPIVDWLLEASWRYQAAALLNLVTQLSPMLAVLFVRRPLARAFAGLMFVVEVLMLGVVVGLWNLHWLPLAAAFVDWDRLAARLRASPGQAAGTPEGWRPPRAARAYVLAFVTYDLLLSLVPTLDRRLNTYPFSSFPMFATIRAREPWAQHLPYSVVAGSFELISDHPVDARAQRWVDHAHRTVHVERDPRVLERRLRAVLERARYFYPDYQIRGLRLWLVIHEAPAYPAPARFEKHPIAVLGEITADGAFRTMLGTLELAPDRAALAPRPVGVDLPSEARLTYYRDDRPEPVELPARLAAGRFDLTGQALPGDPRYFVTVAAGVPWLIASRQDRW